IRMASSKKNDKNENEASNRSKKRKSIIDLLYVKLLRDPSTNFIIVIVAIVFIIWMVVPLILVLSGGVYFNGIWSTQPITNVFTDPVHFNFPGDNTTQLFQIGEQQVGGPSVSVVVKDDLAFVAERSDGIEIINIANTSSLTEVTNYYDEISSFTDLEIQGNYLYTAAGESGLTIFDITNVYDSFLPVSFMPNIVNSSEFLTFENNLVYLDANGKGFSIIDVSDVTDPQLLSTVTIETDTKNIAISGNYAFLVGYSTGILVYDVTDPSNPTLANTYNNEAVIGVIRAQDIKIVGDYAYVTLGLFGYAIFDVTNPLDISLVSYKSDIKCYDVDVSGNYTYVTIRDDLQLDYGITVLDSSNTSNILEQSYYNTTIFRTQDIFIDEASNQIFLAQEKGGLQILDKSSITNLNLVGEYVDTQTVNVLVLSGVNRGVVVNTIILGLTTTILSILLGTALAFILARFEFPGKRLVSVLALAPLISPPFISGMGFRLILGPNGFLNNFFLIPTFNFKIIFEGFIAIALVQASHFYALVYLNAFSSFINIDPTMEESAENLGAGSGKLFRSITLPLAMPGIGAGAILVLILSMEDVGTPIIFAAMGDNAAKHYLTYYIFENYARAGSAVITPEVCVLGGILLIMAIIGFFVIRKYISLRKYSMVSKGRAGQYRMAKAGWKLLYIYPFLFLLFVYSLLVHVGVILMSLMETLGVDSPGDIKFTLENYRLIFVSSAYQIPTYVINTLVYSVIATLLIVVLGSLAAYVISRKDFRGRNLLDALVTLPIAIPGIVLAIGYYRAFDWSGIATRNPNWFTKFMAYLTSSLRLDPFIGVAVTLLILSYAVRKFPFTVRSAYAGLQQTDVVLEEAAFNLGASRAKTFTSITIPLISLNVFAGSLVSFLYCLSEVSTTIFLIFQANAGTITWYMAWNPLKFQIFCALGVILMFLQIVSLIITNVILGSRAEAITGI
ncbi:MAG: ABC transporter permease subunit, partial [Candidatus Heimdallarchaeota archaeon]|nr:ABC transporter permease subunit [Candidatus Heimdallarchaeota archaeon]